MNPKYLLAIVFALPFVTGCTGEELTNGESDSCIVTVSGNEVCGENADSWCDMTDELRDMANDAASKEACDEVRQ